MVIFFLWSFKVLLRISRALLRIPRATVRTCMCLHVVCQRGVLQCVAVCCSVLQCVALCRRVLNIYICMCVWVCACARVCDRVCVCIRVYAPTGYGDALGRNEIEYIDGVPTERYTHV